MTLADDLDKQIAETAEAAVEFIESEPEQFVSLTESQKSKLRDFLNKARSNAELKELVIVERKEEEETQVAKAEARALEQEKKEQASLEREQSHEVAEAENENSLTSLVAVAGVLGTVALVGVAAGDRLGLLAEGGLQAAAKGVKIPENELANLGDEIAKGNAAVKLIATAITPAQAAELATEGQEAEARQASAGFAKLFQSTLSKIPGLEISLRNVEGEEIYSKDRDGNFETKIAEVTEWYKANGVETPGKIGGIGGFARGASGSQTSGSAA